jgi:hypothetical protein
MVQIAEHIELVIQSFRTRLHLNIINNISDQRDKTLPLAMCYIVSFRVYLTTTELFNRDDYKRFETLYETASFTPVFLLFWCWPSNSFEENT